MRKPSRQRPAADAVRRSVRDLRRWGAGPRLRGPAVFALLGVSATTALLTLETVDIRLSPANASVVWSALCSLFALGALILLLWRGRSVFWAAPALAIFLAFTAPGETPIEFFETSFAAPSGRFIAQFLPIFVVSSVFGHVLDASGCATSLALGLTNNTPRPIVPLVVAGVCALLMMGGVGVFVIAFSVFPIAKAVYVRAQLPLHLAPAAIALGAFTATMTAVPGAPSLNNIIASVHLGTGAFAAPGIGILATGVMTTFGSWWLVRRATRSPEAGYPDPTDIAATPIPFSLALLPLVVAVMANWATSWGLIHLLDARTGAMGPTYWSVISGLLCGIAAAMLINMRLRLKLALDRGALAAIPPLVATAVGFGFGVILAALPAARSASAWLSNTLGEPLYASAATTALYSGIVGSSSGGLALWFEANTPSSLLDDVAPETLHRIVAIASGTIDTLPHSAAIIALLSICQCKHAHSYRDLFIVSVIGPTIALLVVLALAGAKV